MKKLNIIRTLRGLVDTGSDGINLRERVAGSIPRCAFVFFLTVAQRHRDWHFLLPIETTSTVGIEPTNLAGVRHATYVLTTTLCQLMRNF